MAAFDEEFAKFTTKNLSGHDVVNERLLWLGTAAVIGLLVALLLGLSGALEPDSTHDVHIAEALRLSTTAPQR